MPPIQREWGDLKVKFEKAQESNELLKDNEKEIQRLKQDLQESKVCINGILKVLF